MVVYDRTMLQGLKALVVNDEIDQAALMSLRLNNEGIGEIYTASNFSEARQVVRSRKPDIAVIDTEVKLEWGPNLAEELYRLDSGIYVVGTSSEAKNAAYWKELADFQSSLAFDAKQAIERYFQKKFSPKKFRKAEPF